MKKRRIKCSKILANRNINVKAYLAPIIAKRISWYHVLYPSKRTTCVNLFYATIFVAIISVVSSSIETIKRKTAIM